MWKYAVKEATVGEIRRPCSMRFVAGAALGGVVIMLRGLDK